MQVDASDDSLGFVLLQNKEEKLLPIAYGSKRLTPTQKKYSTIEKEGLAIIVGIQKYEPYLYGREFILQTDHRPLTFLKRKEFKNPRIMRWALYFQLFRFIIESIKGTDSITADYLSRTTSVEEE